MVHQGYLKTCDSRILSQLPVCLRAFQITAVAMLLLYCQYTGHWDYMCLGTFHQHCMSTCNPLMHIHFSGGKIKEQVTCQDMTMYTSMSVCIYLLIFKSLGTTQGYFNFIFRLDWQIGYWTEWYLIHTCCVMYHPKDQSSWWNYSNSQPQSWGTWRRIWSQI